MTRAATLLAPLAAMALLAGCAWFRRAPQPTPTGPLPAGALLPSHNLLVGRVLAVDVTRGFAFVDLASDPPAAALGDGADLVARTDDLRETARLRASRYIRGRTLATRIVSGQPAPGNEVVWPAP